MAGSGGSVQDYMASLDKVAERGTKTLDRRVKDDLF